jgi:hypothetical protein
MVVTTFAGRYFSTFVDLSIIRECSGTSTPAVQAEMIVGANIRMHRPMERERGGHFPRSIGHFQMLVGTAAARVVHEPGQR